MSVDTGAREPQRWFRDDFARWYRESAGWTGADFLWVNRYRELYRALAAGVGVPPDKDSVSAPAERSGLNVGMRDAEAKDELVGAPAEEQPDARRSPNEVERLRMNVRGLYEQRNEARAECVRLREQLNAATKNLENEYLSRAYWAERAEKAEAQLDALAEAAKPLANLPYPLSSDERVQWLERQQALRAALGVVAAAETLGSAPHTNREDARVPLNPDGSPERPGDTFNAGLGPFT